MFKKLFETIREYNRQYVAARGDASVVHRRRRALRLVTTSIFIYSILAPFIIEMIGIGYNHHNIMVEFAVLAGINIVVLGLWFVFRYTKRYRGEQNLAKQGHFIQHLTWLEVVGLYSWSMLALYFSITEGRTMNFYTWLIVALVVVAGFTFNIYESICLNLYGITGLMVIALKYWDRVEDKTQIYNIVIFFLVLTYFMVSKYVVFMNDYKHGLANKRMQEEKERFMVNVTHEMRTPLTAVLGKNEIILNDTKEEATKELSKEIASGGKILLTLINDILDFSKLEAGKMTISPAEYSTHVITDEIVDILSSEATKKNLELKAEFGEEIPAKLFGDDVRIRQVIMNLLSNAIKYTKQGSVVFKIDFEKNGDSEYGKLIVKIKDTGVGIKPEDIPKLTEAFSRVDSEENRNVVGTGLGLAVTASLLSLMNSELKVESEYGKGSEFSFEVEQRVVDSEKLSECNKPVAVEKKKFKAPDAKVLVVDDNRVNFSVCKGLMKYYEIVPDYAPGGAECLSSIADKKYDIVFIDHLMPGMSGVETLEAIKKDFPDVYKETPIIALTANAGNDIAAEYKGYGFTDYLGKPIDSGKLYDVLRAALKDILTEEVDG